MSDSNKFLNPKVIVPVLGLIVLAVAGTLIGVFYFRNPAVTDQLFNSDGSGSEGSGDSEHRLEAVTAEALVSETTTSSSHSTTHGGSTHEATTSTATTAASLGTTVITTTPVATSTLKLDHEATIEQPKLARAIEPVRHE